MVMRSVSPKNWYIMKPRDIRYGNQQREQRETASENEHEEREKTRTKQSRILVYSVSSELITHF